MLEGIAVDYRQFHNLESYLLDVVRPRFLTERRLSAFDFFCIVIWKANRAKSKIARTLLAHGSHNLEAAVHALTSGLAEQRTARERLYHL